MAIFRRNFTQFEIQRWGSKWLVCTALFAIVSGVAAAQEAGRDHLLPRALPNDGDRGLIAPSEKAAVGARDSTTLVDALRGVVLIDDPAEIARPANAGIDVSLLEFPNKDALAAQLGRFLNRALSLALLDEMNTAIVAFARRNDRPVVDAFAPEGQDISDGIVRIVVVSGRRGQIRVEGMTPAAGRGLARQTSIEPGGVITESSLRADLDWLNRNPFRSVNAVLERGQAFGETDIIYDVVSRRPLRWYGGLEDSGARVSGKERWLTGVNWGDAFGFGHQLNYQFTSSFDTSALNAHSVSYSAPLAWRHVVELFGSHVDSTPDVAATAPFALAGKSWQLGLRYRVPLASVGALQHEVAFGYDFKRSNNDLEFGSLRVASTTTVVAQFVADYSAAQEDALGSTNLSLRLFVSPGDMFSANSDSNFASSRFAASADYVYGRLALTRLTSLPWATQWSSSLEFQYSSNNLLGSEQLGLGGYRTIRGYDDYAAPSDLGAYFRNELRTPVFSIFAHAFDLDAADQLQLLGFMDYGVGRNKERLRGEPVMHLWSVGVGLRYFVSHTLSARIDYGWQLEDQLNDGAGNGRLHLGAMLTY